MFSSASSTRRTVRRLVPALFLFALLLVLVPATGTAADTPGKSPKHSPPQATDEILVKFKTPANGPAAVTAAGDTAVAQTLERVQIVKLHKGASVADAVARYKARSDVVYAEPNYKVKATGFDWPNDTYLFSNWWYYLDSLNTLAGWTIFPGSYGTGGTVKIAVVDTGVYAGHEDLAGKVLSSSGADCINSTYTCTPWSGGSIDPYGHGTFVAGIAAATADNGKGVAGIAFDAPIIPVRVLDEYGYGTDASVANGITWARLHGANVINLSLGRWGISSTTCGAVNAALAAGIVVVAASGNDGTNYPQSPAGCPGVIGVAATGADESSADFSNWGYPNTFISAPGVDIFSTAVVDLYTGEPADYIYADGTSASSPFVAGLAALLKEQQPSRSVSDIKRILAKTASKIGAPFGYYGINYGSWSPNANPYNACATCKWHGYYGYGQINIGAALLGPPPSITSFSPASAALGGTVTINGEDLDTTTGVTFAKNGGGDAPASFSIVSQAKLTATVPNDAVTGPIKVTNPTGTAVSANFKPLPTITSIAPSTVQVGDSATLYGSNLGGTTVLKLGSLTIPSASYHVYAGEIDIDAIPSGALTGKFSLTTAGGTSTSLDTLKVRPKITSFAPATGLTGTVVTLTGQTFTGTTGVKVGGVAASFSVASYTQLKVTIPAAAAGDASIDVTNAGGVETSSAPFLVKPKITGFTPASAVAGTVLTISGSGFAAVSDITIGGVSVVAELSSASPTSLKLTLPSRARTGPIAVTCPNGTATSATAFKPVPKITGLSPSSLYEGDGFTITGTNLLAASSVKLGSLSLAGYSIIDDGAISATVPANGLTGKVSVTTPGGTSTSASSLLVKPQIVTFSPSSGPSGTVVTLNGDSLTGTSSVKIGGAAVSYVVNSNTKLTVTATAAALTGPISVTTPGGTATSGTSFTVTPRITGFTPTSGPAGTVVSISGSGLGGVNKVQFNGANATSIVSTSATLVKATVPVDASTGDVYVETSDGLSAVSSGIFKPVPKVTSFSTPTTFAGSIVYLYGGNFLGVTQVKIGAVVASFSVDSATQITMVVSDNAVTGTVAVSSAAGSATSSTSLKILPTVNEPPSPASAKTGTAVTVTGKTFTGTTAVKLNGLATTFTVVSGTQLRFTVPSNATTGKIAVTNAGGTSTTSADFQVLPNITGFSPVSGPTGTLVTVNGSGFGATAPAVCFAPDTCATGATYVSPNLVRAVVPADAQTGTIKVVTADGTAISASSYTVSFGISSLSVKGGVPGHSVTISGSGFVGVTSIRFGSTPASPFTIPVDGKSITTTVPAGASTGKITVYKGSASVVSADTFVVPKITSVSVSPGDDPDHTEAGYSVTVAGDGFTSGSPLPVIEFGGQTITPSSRSATSFAFTVPDEAISGDLTVTIADASYGGDTLTGPNHFVVFPTITSLSKTTVDPTASWPDNAVFIDATGIPAIGQTVEAGGSSVPVDVEYVYIDDPVNGVCDADGGTLSWTPAGVEVTFDTCSGYGGPVVVGVTNPYNLSNPLIATSSQTVTVS